MGINFKAMDTVAKYAENCGVKSILQTKTAELSKVNFSELKVLKTASKALSEKNILNASSDKDLPFFQPLYEKWMKFGIALLRKEPFSAKQEVAIIEQRLAQQGVFARFKNDLELATVVESGLTKAKKSGFELPKYMIINGQKKAMGSVMHFSRKNASEAPIFLSENYISQQKIELEINKQTYATHAINKTSTNSMDGIVCHEITHWLHHHDMPDKKTCENIWKTVNEKKVVPEVSFSILQDKAGKEFVAEVGAGLMDGKTYSDYVMDIYKQLKGPMPKSLLERDSSPILNHIS